MVTDYALVVSSQSIPTLLGSKEESHVGGKKEKEEYSFSKNKTGRSTANPGLDAELRT